MLAPLALVSCAQPQACTLIGADSGASIHLPSGIDAETWHVEMCVEGDCMRGHTRAAEQGGGEPDGEPDTFIAHAGIDSERPTTVTLSIVAGEGAPVSDGGGDPSGGGEILLGPVEQTVTPEKIQPNGENCPPTVHQVDIDLRS